MLWFPFVRNVIHANLLLLKYLIRVLPGHVQTVSNEHSIQATLNVILAYAPVFMQYITTFYVPFHTRLRIINSPQSAVTMGEWVTSKGGVRVGVNTR